MNLDDIVFVVKNSKVIHLTSRCKRIKKNTTVSRVTLREVYASLKRRNSKAENLKPAVCSYCKKMLK